jgi:hypothetical protein
MRISDLPTAELLRLLRASERAADPDEYALSVLRRELARRLDLAKDQDGGTSGREATPCRE